MAQKHLETIIKESTIKNLIVIVCCFLFYPNLKTSLSVVSTEVMGDLLLVISIFLVTVSFASFAFTYEKINLKSLGSRMLAHSATFLFLLLTALLLETMVIAVGVVYPSIYGISIVFSVLLYLSIIFYDVWDLFRLK
jgi:hypothetical protein